MVNEEVPLTVCGLDCTECTIFRAQEEPEMARRVAEWFHEEQNVEIAPEEIRCPAQRIDEIRDTQYEIPSHDTLTR